MVRTKQSMNYVVSVGKSSKSAAAAGKSSSGGSSSSSASYSTGGFDNGSSTPGKNKKYSGGNPVCLRETPVWQKEITCFFGTKSQLANGDDSDQDDDPRQMNGPSGSSA
ncbi:PCNA-associated factor-like [Adelges cooleyi]|uniref:PCNA-associated factor-like n=1 Tax=Adelges cooleyi TaxID=133065 RepID=UPI00217F2A8E|nr:PCNA-associated factor-like [Adelges cooleyi]